MSIGKVDDSEFQAWANRVKLRIGRNEAKKEIGDTAKNIGTKGLNLLQDSTPVDTGKLRGAWDAQGPFYGGRAWVVKFYNNTEYASYVEEGHRTRGGSGWVSGRFFMHRSMNTLESQLPSLMTEGLWAFRGLLD